MSLRVWSHGGLLALKSVCDHLRWMLLCLGDGLNCKSITLMLWWTSSCSRAFISLLPQWSFLWSFIDLCCRKRPNNIYGSCLVAALQTTVGPSSLLRCVYSQPEPARSPLGHLNNNNVILLWATVGFLGICLWHHEAFGWGNRTRRQKPHVCNRCNAKFIFTVK